MTAATTHFDTAVIGAGNIGISVAYYLAVRHGVRNICMIDPRDPMSLTSAQSGENYRNWWPNPVMANFTNRSIDLMEEIARATDNRIQITRRGYCLVTRRSEPDDLIAELFAGYGEDAEKTIRIHNSANSKQYSLSPIDDWRTAPDGVDVLLNRKLIQRSFPSYADGVATILHIRRAGSISAQQLGQFMLEKIRELGGRLIRAKVINIENNKLFHLTLEDEGQTRTVVADRLVNAAGPFLGDVAAMLGEKLPVKTIYHQKIAFEDREAAIPRNMPFTIDLDGQHLPWTQEEREILAEDTSTARFLEPMHGGIHCRPDGAETGTWVKLGWAYNETPTDPHGEDPQDPHFPDIVLRAASRLHPKLAAYIGRLPRSTHHYGGYYTMTDENWPLIGPMATPGAYVAGALSGYGSMAACATGDIVAGWMIAGAPTGWPYDMSLLRYQDAALMSRIASEKKGHL